MFGIGEAELLVIAVVALVVIGPKDLPGVMRGIGKWVGQARGMAKHFRSGIDTMMREAELEEMEKKWKADNERIMREFPAAAAGEPWPEPVAADKPIGSAGDLPVAPPASPPSPKAARPNASRPKAPPPRSSTPGRTSAPRPKRPPVEDAQ